MMTNDRDSISDGLGVFSVNEEDQLTPSDTLDDDSRDPLDVGYRVGEQYRCSSAYSDSEETIDQRIRQEERDPYSAYGAPYREGEEAAANDDDGMVGGDDPDAIRADLDYYGGETHRVGRIIAPDEGRYPDREARLIAREGRATSWDSPEESAMHFVDGDDDLTEEEWAPPTGARPDEEE